MVQISSITMPSLVGIRFCMLPEDKKDQVFRLCVVFLSVMLLNDSL